MQNFAKIKRQLAELEIDAVGTCSNPEFLGQNFIIDFIPRKSLELIRTSKDARFNSANRMKRLEILASGIEVAAKEFKNRIKPRQPGPHSSSNIVQLIPITKGV